MARGLMELGKKVKRILIARVTASRFLINAIARLSARKLPL
jgi:hypothetical protein